MHCIRLLDCAIQIAKENTFNVRVKDRDLLIRIRCGEFTYEDILDLACGKKDSLDILYNESILPNEIDMSLIKNVMYEIKSTFYLLNFSMN
jgi:hypothetical protein